MREVDRQLRLGREFSVTETARNRFKARFTPLARATVSSLRLELIKVAARVTSSVRRIFIELPRAYPFQRDWLRIASALGALA